MPSCDVVAGWLLSLTQEMVLAERSRQHIVLYKHRDLDHTTRRLAPGAIVSFQFRLTIRSLVECEKIGYEMSKLDKARAGDKERQP